MSVSKHPQLKPKCKIQTRRPLKRGSIFARLPLLILDEICWSLTCLETAFPGGQGTFAKFLDCKKPIGIRSPFFFNAEEQVCWTMIPKLPRYLIQSKQCPLRRQLEAEDPFVYFDRPHRIGVNVHEGLPCEARDVAWNRGLSFYVVAELLNEVSNPRQTDWARTVE